jgi:deazaflavin-dependent oxidoreductase (nitroreductase family)
VASDWNKHTIDEFRRTSGKQVGDFGDKLILLTTRGRKTGRELTVPLVYRRDGDRLVIAASKGGAPKHPEWYLNVLAQPEVGVELGTERFRARARAIPSGSERDRLYELHGQHWASFRDYPAKTTRTIPVIVLERLPG